MTAFAQGAAGVALVMAFALLRTRQINGAALLLAVQSAAVAVSAIALHRPLMALPPVLLGAGIWLVRRRPIQPPHGGSIPLAGAKLGIGVAAILAVLCQSLGDLALPTAIVLLSILLAAIRSHPFMHVIALVGAQNGVVLAGAIAGDPALPHEALSLSLACIVLPLPLAIYRLEPMPFSRARAGPVIAWIDLGLALGTLAAAAILPLNGLAVVFVPLIAFDGVIKAVIRRNRAALTPARRGAALLQTAFMVLAVGTSNLGIAWLAVLGAIVATVLPAAPRRWDTTVLAMLAAALALLGLILLPAAQSPVGAFAAVSPAAAQSIIGSFSLFAGFALIAATVPELATVLVVLILRIATRSSWPPDARTLGIAMAVIGLLACAILLTGAGRSHRTTLLLLSQASIAALIICTGQPDGRFAGLILLILLILTRSAARLADGPAAALARAGLAGITPLGVFPGLVLVALALSAHAPWLLLPVGLASVPIAWASSPMRPRDFLPRAEVPSLAWLPLALALLAGYFTPDRLVEWLRLVTAGPT